MMFREIKEGSSKDVVLQKIVQAIKTGWEKKEGIEPFWNSRPRELCSRVALS